jgi:tetratricopeptide (TPR) repeat protein
MSTWATCLESQNNPRDAEARYRDLLLLQKSSNDSPYNTILTETSLATFLVRQNRLEDAAQVFEHSEKWQKAQLGQEYHTIESLGVLFQLAGAYMKTNESKTAIPLFDKVLRHRREFYGNTTGQVLNTMNNLALAYLQNKAYSKALSIYKKICDIRRRQAQNELPRRLESDKKSGLLLLQALQV